MTGGLYRDSLADNPYADETMWKVENAIVEATDKINAEVRVLEGILRNIPSVITVRDALSRSPCRYWGFQPLSSGLPLCMASCRV